MNIVFFGGLPRSGSTLLCSILSQNPEICTGRISNLCDLMWNAQWSLDNYAGFSGLPAKNHGYIMSNLPEIYYKDDLDKTIIDQCRAWTLPANLSMITRYITPEPKVICLTRDIDEIRNSYINLFLENGRNDFEGSGYETELMRNISAVENAKTLPEKNVHWVNYNDLVLDTENTLQKIYSFLEKESYKHDLKNIICDFENNELHNGLSGLHTVRKEIGFRN